MKQRLEIQNFGPINEAKIDIDKITVIAGPNASGKTTSSKLLYCLLASSSSEGAYIINQSIIQRLDRPLRRALYNADDEKTYDKINDLRKQIRYINDFFGDGNLQENYFKIINDLNIFPSETEINDIHLALEMSGDNLLLYKEIMNLLLKIEFHKPSLFESSVTFKHTNIKDSKFEVSILDDNVENVTGEYLKFFEVNAVSYIETPYILDFLIPQNHGVDLRYRSPRYPSPSYRRINKNHQRFLIDKLYDEEEKDVFDRKLNENIIQIQKKIENIIKGTLKFDYKLRKFVFEQENDSFPSNDIAVGIKSLGILQMLLDNRKLPENSYLIMDEPEVHLHPAWQVKLAEILVILSKELNISVYINSHSPQFIEAIEVYSKYYDISKNTNFYLTLESENGKFNFKKIESKNLVQIYDCLGNPYDVLDDIRGKNDAFDVIQGRD